MNKPVHRLHQLPFLCLLILCLLTSPASSFGYVWCVGADGHATLEAALAGDCGMDAPAVPAKDSPYPVLTADTDDCGPCLDVSPSLQWASTRHRDSGAPAVLPLPLATGFAAELPHPADLTLTNRLITKASPRLSEPILLHRTIVLLI